MDGSKQNKANEKTGDKTNKGQRTANRILDVAEELFAHGGFGAISMRDIADRVGIQQPGLYKHFASKEELYRQVYERALKPLSDLMEDILSGPDDMPMLDDLSGRLTDLLALHPNITRLLVRSNTRTPTQEDEVAREWLIRLTDYGRRISEKSGMAADKRLLAVQIVAVYNVLFGYFSAAPLIETLSGTPAYEPAMLNIQKTLLRGLVDSFRDNGNNAQNAA